VAWWGYHLLLSADPAYTPIPCKHSCGEGPQNERKQVLHQQAVWGWGWGAALTFGSFGLHLSLKVYLGKHKAWIKERQLPACNRTKRSCILKDLVIFNKACGE